MSLYDSISKSLSTKGITTGIGDGINSALGGLKLTVRSFFLVVRKI